MDCPSNEAATTYKETMKREPTLLPSSRPSDRYHFGTSVTCGDAPTKDDARIASGSSKSGGGSGIEKHAMTGIYWWRWQEVGGSAI
jgi:hypothetical protein